MSDVPYILLVNATVKPEYLTEVLETAAVTLAHTLKEPGCVAFHQTAYAQDPTHLCFFEYFASEAAHAEHMAQSYTQAFMALLDGKLVTAPDMQRLTLAPAG
ncbi:putative quinol monooxygenase [Pseudomonas sp. NPDC088368]|jgi:quinol monooxygenase YgiN|uniref:putative quinol monooxygenase n=1 Tax=Pseudomonas sp. NPDC088368 TaxID=3364453 RepID=UPI003805DB2C